MNNIDYVNCNSSTCIHWNSIFKTCNITPIFGKNKKCLSQIKLEKREQHE